MIFGALWDTRFSDWLKSTPAPDFAAFNSQVLWAFGSISFTLTACGLMIWGDTAAREAGLGLAGFLLTAWTGKSYQNRKSNEVQRQTSREHLQGLATIEREKAAGAAAGTVQAAAAVAEATLVTSERLALPPGPPPGGSPVLGPASRPPGDLGVPVLADPAPGPDQAPAPHEWAPGAPAGGTLG